jgi:hypothetical protein
MLTSGSTAEDLEALHGLAVSLRRRAYQANVANLALATCVWTSRDLHLHALRNMQVSLKLLDDVVDGFLGVRKCLPTECSACDVICKRSNRVITLNLEY